MEQAGGTSFLLCPQATTGDSDTMELLLKFKENQLIRSKSSPLGVAFNYSKGTTGEIERLNRLEKWVPGSPGTKNFLFTIQNLLKNISVPHPENIKKKGNTA